MKHWIKRTLFSLLGAGILFGGLTACGHQRHTFGSNMSAEDQAQMRDKIVARISGKLDLNAEQKQRLNVLADKLQEQRAVFVGIGIETVVDDEMNLRTRLVALVGLERFGNSLERQRLQVQFLRTAEESASINEYECDRLFVASRE